jgi:hypothetical protein
LPGPVGIITNIKDLISIIRGDLEGDVVETECLRDVGEAHPLIKADT